jgi:hypothetical protein
MNNLESISSTMIKEIGQKIDVFKDQLLKANRPGSMPGDRYPVTDLASLQDAIRAVGRSKGGAAGRAKVRRHIMARARALGLSQYIPDTWNADGSLKS